MSHAIKLSAASAAREVPVSDRLDRIILSPNPGLKSSSKPAVRIFVGSEDRQDRAERVLVYSIEKSRDQTRVYEIYIMKRLSGFTRAGWRTGFTNYRYAVPEFAGRQGRAIYNDVDQIYTGDPGELFDLDLSNHGYLAVSKQDTSVMLVDCARLSAIWNLAAATSQSKEDLLNHAAKTPGLYGQLDPDWNARDLEYVEGRSKLLHFTAMHLQPWQPFPADYSYHPHPLAEIWHRLERAANTEGFQLFNAGRPSVEFERVRELHRAIPTPVGTGNVPTSTVRSKTLPGVSSVLQVGFGADGAQLSPSNATALTMDRIDIARSGFQWPAGKRDLVVAFQLLERAPSEDVPWLIDQLFRHAVQQVHAVVECFSDDESAARSSNDIRCARDALWWRDRFVAAARHHSHLAWDLETVHKAGHGRAPSQTFRFRPDPKIDAKPPKIWVLAGGRAGDRAQLTGLAEKLGWPFELKRLGYNALSQLPNLLLGASCRTLDKKKSDHLREPWPDLILDCGRRSVPIARWIRSQSGSRARWVHLGRPWAPLDWFDLVVTTPQYRVLQRPNVLQIALPFHNVTAERLAQASAGWDHRLSALPRPWIAVLIGGNSTSQIFAAQDAQRLGRLVNAAAIAAGGSLLITTSPRTPVVATSALQSAITAPNFFHGWRQGEPENPYLAFLALADRIIVTGDSASMVAEACSTGKPVSLFELRARPALAARLLRAVDWLIGAIGGDGNYRGMPRQQNGLARAFDRLVEIGVFMPARDMAHYQEALLGRGMVERIGEPSSQPRRGLQDESNIVIDRIQTLMTIEQTGNS